MKVSMVNMAKEIISKLKLKSHAFHLLAYEIRLCGDYAKFLQWKQLNIDTKEIVILSMLPYESTKTFSWKDMHLQIHKTDNWCRWSPDMQNSCISLVFLTWEIGEKWKVKVSICITCKKFKISSTMNSLRWLKSLNGY